MKKNILIIIGLVVIEVICSNTLSVAQSEMVKPSIDAYKTTPEEEQTSEYKYIVKDYDKELLNSLVAIESDLQNDNIKGTKDEADEILGYITYYKKEAQRRKDIAEKLNTNNHKSYRVLELKYGNWPGYKKLLVPIAEKNGINADSLKGRTMLLAYFKDNKINSAAIRYVTCNVESEQLRLDLRKLLSGIEEGNVDYIHESIKDIYGDVVLYGDNRIPIIAKILDNLVLIKYLIENNQTKAAKDAITITNSQMSMLADTIYNFPAEQQKIRDLQKTFSDISKISDANYIAEWQKISNDIAK